MGALGNNLQAAFQYKHTHTHTQPTLELAWLPLTLEHQLHLNQN